MTENFEYKGEWFLPNDKYLSEHIINTFEDFKLIIVADDVHLLAYRW